MDKYKYGTYHKGYFRGVINVCLNLKMCEDNIFIPSIPSKLRITLVPYVSHSYINGYNGSNDSPIFLLARHN